MTIVTAEVAPGVAVKVLVGVSDGVSVLVAVSVGVSVWVLVAVSVGVSVGALVAVAVGVSVWVLVAELVGESVGVAVSVGVPVGALVAVSVGVSVDVAVAVPVGVAVAVGEFVTVAVAVGVLVCVDVDDGVAVHGWTTLHLNGTTSGALAFWTAAVSLVKSGAYPKAGTDVINATAANAHIARTSPTNRTRTGSSYSGDIHAFAGSALAPLSIWKLRSMQETSEIARHRSGRRRCKAKNSFRAGNCGAFYQPGLRLW